MTPAARVQAAIEVLDQVFDGLPAERALTNWARSSRYAGSGDRAAVRDHVYEALRCRRSFGWLGGAETGRGLMAGACRAAGLNPDEVFTGQTYAPAPLSDAEVGHPLDQAPLAVQLDCPDWLMPKLETALGADLEAVLNLFRSRAPVYLRVNIGATDIKTAVAALAEDGIGTQPHANVNTALEAIENTRKIQNSRAYREGLVELQDAASQALCLALKPLNGKKVLDYCAGGGGKSLALAALGASVTAHDAIPQRMRDLPDRAVRAGVSIPVSDDPGTGWDLVLTDVPCSGTGTWRRDPQSKWGLDGQGLEGLLATQSAILDQAALLVGPAGRLAYATCSLLIEENEAQIDAFLKRTDGWHCRSQQRFNPLDGGDGFFLATIARV